MVVLKGSDGVSVTDPDTATTGGFRLNLDNFSGPLDLLLSLIARRQLDVTQVALAEVTDEFLEYVSTIDTDEYVLEESSSFVVVAATLLEMKTAQLLPSSSAGADEDFAALEAYDLLFVRLLQYKAFKEVAGMISARLSEEAGKFPRSVGPDFSASEVITAPEQQISPDFLAKLAHQVFSHPQQSPQTEVGIDHLHVVPVSVVQQKMLMLERLRSSALTFTELIDDAGARGVVIARFLGLLEMFRDREITLEQSAPLGMIMVGLSQGRQYDEDSSDREDETVDA